MNARSTRRRNLILALLALGSAGVVGSVWLASRAAPGSEVRADAAAPVAGARVELAEAEPSVREFEDALSGLEAVPEPARAAAQEAPPPVQAPEPEVALDGVRGTVRDLFGVPLAQATVTLRAQRGERGAELAAAVTGLDGSYSFSLKSWPTAVALARSLPKHDDAPRARAAHELLQRTARTDVPFDPFELAASPALDRKRGQRRPAGPIALSVSASCAGYQPQTEQREIRAVVPERLQVDFALAAGTALTGRVLRAAGARGRSAFAPDAQVLLLNPGHGVAARARSGPDGRYVFFLETDGQYDLFARHSSFGTGILRGVRVDRSSGWMLPDLSLSAGASIRGEVRYPDGEPARALRIHAWHESVAARGEGGLSEIERVELERDKGLVQSACVTADDGSFVLEGLQLGRFELVLPDEDETSLQLREWVASGAQSVRLVYRGYRLRVSVEQIGASPADPPQVECWKIGAEGVPLPEGVLVGQWSEAGEFLAIVDPGDRLFVRAWASNGQLDWTTVAISPASYETQATLTLYGNFDAHEWKESGASAGERKDALGGRVDLRVLDERGDPLKGWRATATTADGLVPSGWRGARPAADGRLPPLPPGEYTLQLAPVEEQPFRNFDDARARFRVRLGATEQVELRVPLLGRLRLVLAEESRDPGAPQYGSKAVELEERGWNARAEPHGAGAQPPIQLSLRADAGLGRADGTRALPGSSVLCTPLLTPGRYTIRLSRAGSEDRTQLVEVAAGAVCEARL